MVLRTLESKDRCRKTWSNEAIALYELVGCGIFHCGILWISGRPFQLLVFWIFAAFDQTMCFLKIPFLLLPFQGCVPSL